MDLGIKITATIYLAIAEVIILVMMVDMDTCHKRPDTISLAIGEFIILVLMVEVELGLNRPTTLPFTIVDKDLMLKGEVDIGLIPATITRAYQEVVLACWFYHLLIVL